jgi:hypothetical protein
VERQAQTLVIPGERSETRDLLISAAGFSLCVSIQYQAKDPAALHDNLTNGSRLCPRHARLAGMTLEVRYA